MAEGYDAAVAQVHCMSDEMFGQAASVVAGLDQCAAFFSADMSSRFGVDLSDPAQRRAAFAGAWSMFEFVAPFIFPTPVVAGMRAELAAYVTLEELATR